MKFILIVLFLGVLWTGAHNQELILNEDFTANQELSYALTNAAHDAALMVQMQTVSSGDIVFDQAESQAVFNRTLADDLNLNQTTLQPKPNSLFQSAPVVLVQDFLDYSNAAFPYHYVNSTYGIDTTILGPSIVYVVKIPAPKYGGTQAPSFNDTWTTVATYEGNS